MFKRKLAEITLVKAGPEDGLADGQFQAYASVFDNVDAYGDIVRKGAFAETLTEWGGSKANLPVLFGHEMFDPDYNIGHVVDAVEDDRGLLVTAQLDIESDTGKARQVYRLIKGGRVNQMSFAYDVLEANPITVDGSTFQELTRLKLYEVSVVTIGANQETEILAVKARAVALAEGIKEGRVLAQKHIDSLREAQVAIGAVIAAAEATDQEKASGHAAVGKDEGASGVKSEAAPFNPSADALVLERLEIELEASV